MSLVFIDSSIFLGRGKKGRKNTFIFFANEFELGDRGKGREGPGDHYFSSDFVRSNLQIGSFFLSFSFDTGRERERERDPEWIPVILIPV